MYLEGVSGLGRETTSYFERSPSHAPVYSPWSEWLPSEIWHHGDLCCETAREWLYGIDFSSLNGGEITSGPRWLRNRFSWGPATYPVHWCDVLEKKTLDCGIHAALAHEAFMNRGVRSYRLQVVQEFSNEAADHWRLVWESEDSVTAWLNGRMIYHEGCAIVATPGEIKLWDPSSAWWLDPSTTSGYGSLRALKISAGTPLQLKWGPHDVVTDQWIELDRVSRR